MASAVAQATRRLLPDIEHRLVSTAAGRSHVLVDGPIGGRPVVLLHGLAGTAVSWTPDIRLVGRTRRVYAIDLPGEPGLSTRRRLPFADRAHSSWLAETLDALAIERCDLVGESLGGWVALEFAGSLGDRVDRLVLFSTSGLGHRRVTPLLAAIALSVLGARGREAALRYLAGGAAPWRAGRRHRIRTLVPGLDHVRALLAADGFATRAP